MHPIEIDAVTALMLAVSAASGLAALVLSIAAEAHHLVGAARGAHVAPPDAQSWSTRVDPDLLLPPPLDARPTGRVAPPREWVPRG